MNICPIMGKTSGCVLKNDKLQICLHVYVLLSDLTLLSHTEGINFETYEAEGFLN